MVLAGRYLYPQGLGFEHATYHVVDYINYGADSLGEMRKPKVWKYWVKNPFFTLKDAVEDVFRRGAIMWSDPAVSLLDDVEKVHRELQNQSNWMTEHPLLSSISTMTREELLNNPDLLEQLSEDAISYRATDRLVEKARFKAKQNGRSFEVVLAEELSNPDRVLDSLLERGEYKPLSGDDAVPLNLDTGLRIPLDGDSVLPKNSKNYKETLAVVRRVAPRLYKEIIAANKKRKTKSVVTFPKTLARWYNHRVSPEYCMSPEILGPVDPTVLTGSLRAQYRELLEGEKVLKDFIEANELNYGPIAKVAENLEIAQHLNVSPSPTSVDDGQPSFRKLIVNAAGQFGFETVLRDMFGPDYAKFYFLLVRPSIRQADRRRHDRAQQEQFDWMMGRLEKRERAHRGIAAGGYDIRGFKEEFLHRPHLGKKWLESKKCDCSTCTQDFIDMDGDIFDEFMEAVLKNLSPDTTSSAIETMFRDDASLKKKWHNMVARKRAKQKNVLHRLKEAEDKILVLKTRLETREIDRQNKIAKLKQNLKDGILVDNPEPQLSMEELAFLHRRQSEGTLKDDLLRVQEQMGSRLFDANKIEEQIELILGTTNTPLELASDEEVESKVLSRLVTKGFDPTSSTQEQRLFIEALEPSECLEVFLGIKDEQDIEGLANDLLARLYALGLDPNSSTEDQRAFFRQFSNSEAAAEYWFATQRKLALEKARSIYSQRQDDFKYHKEQMEALAQQKIDLKHYEARKPNHMAPNYYRVDFTPHVFSQEDMENEIARRRMRDPPPPSKAYKKWYRFRRKGGDFTRDKAEAQPDARLRKHGESYLKEAEQCLQQQRHQDAAQLFMAAGEAFGRLHEPADMLRAASAIYRTANFFQLSKDFKTGQQLAHNALKMLRRAHKEEPVELYPFAEEEEPMLTHLQEVEEEMEKRGLQLPADVKAQMAMHEKRAARRRELEERLERGEEGVEEEPQQRRTFLPEPLQKNYDVLYVDIMEALMVCEYELGHFGAAATYAELLKDDEDEDLSLVRFPSHQLNKTTRDLKNPEIEVKSEVKRDVMPVDNAVRHQALLIYARVCFKRELFAVCLKELEKLHEIEDNVKRLSKEREQYWKPYELEVDCFLKVGDLEKAVEKLEDMLEAMPAKPGLRKIREKQERCLASLKAILVE